MSSSDDSHGDEERLLPAAQRRHNRLRQPQQQQQFHELEDFSSNEDEDDEDEEDDLVDDDVVDHPAVPAEPQQQQQQHHDEDDLGMMRDLNAEEMEKLVQLQDMTGIDDLAICRALLESKEWDLEATAREQLGMERERHSPQPSAHQQQQHLHHRLHHNSQNNVPTMPVAPNARIVRSVHGRHGGGGGGSVLASIMEWGYYLLTLPVTLPLRLTFSVVQGLYGALASLMGLDVGGGGGRALTAQQSTNPVEDVRQFLSTFESRYGTRHPPVHSGSYAQLLEEAKRDLRFALVYLHSPKHQDTDRFCADTLASQELCQFMQDNDVLFWGCSVETAEGLRVSQALRESTYPFLAVIVLRQGRMMLVGRVEGLIDAGQLVQRLEAVVRDNEAFVVAARMEREERTMNQTIREEQDAAFRETLRQDQEKERLKQEAEDRKRMLEEEERREEKEEADKKERIRKMKMDLVSEVAGEPEPNHPGVVKMSIKLPGGQRLERRFLKSQSLKDLYLFVFCHPESPDEFDITTNFPKKVLKCKPEENPPSFEEAGLGQSTMLFVHDKDA